MSKIIISFVLVSILGWGAYQPQPQAPTPLPEPPKMSLKNPIISPPQDIQTLISKESPQMHPDVIEKISYAFQCLNQAPYPKNLTVIDYALPSNQKRLWVFDLEQHKLLYHTYVSHGLHSGENHTVFFSNQQNSRASSIGVYKTLKNYLGREGSSLRLKGLERGFNDNAEARAIVMHGAFYTEEDFIKKYGRAGRSWGCPALPASQTKAIIDTIKDDNIMIVYYPSEAWFRKSQYLSCNHYTPVPTANILLKDPTLPKNYHTIHDAILLLANGKHYGGELPPILAVNSDYYRQRIGPNIPLERMLRRQIAKQEYIALSKEELYRLALTYTQEDLQQLRLIIATLKTNHGYIQTVMQPINFGKVIGIQTQTGIQLILENHQSLKLEPNDKFIRWLGL